MSRQLIRPQPVLRRFCSDESGVATIDWVLMCCCATGAAMIALDMSEHGLGGYTSDVRDELQTPYFNTSWTDALPIPPEETWGDQYVSASDDDEIHDDDAADDSGGGDGNTDDGGDEDSSHDDGSHDDGGDDDGTLGDEGEDGDQGEDGDGSRNDEDGCDASDPSGNCDDGTDDDGTPDDGTGDGSGNGNGDGDDLVQTVRTEIEVENAGFEDTRHGNGRYSSGVPGWSVHTTGAGDAGDFRPRDRSLPSSYVTGRNVAYIYNGHGYSTSSITQTFDQAYSAGSVYEVTVDIGDGDYSFSGDVAYTLTLYAGSTVIGTLSGTTGDIDGLETVTLTSSVSDAALDGLPISFEIAQPRGSVGDLLVDNVRAAQTREVVVPQVRTIPDGPVAGCPDNASWGGPVSVRTGDQLDDADLLLDVDVGGGMAMQISGACSGIPGDGYFHANPTFTMELSGMDDMDELEIESNGTSCDTVLLVRDEHGNWYYDDNDGPGDESRLKFLDRDYDMSLFNGVVDVWVGTKTGESCSFEMEIDTQD